MTMNEEKSLPEIKSYLEFNLGDMSYAVNLLKVREVIPVPEMTPIPKSPPHVCGLMNLRGQIIPVIDLRKKMGITPSKDKSQMGVIIFDLDDHFAGVVVDCIQKVLNVNQASISPVPENESKDYYLGIINIDGRLCIWLEPTKLLNDIQ